MAPKLVSPTTPKNIEEETEVAPLEKDIPDTYLHYAKVDERWMNLLSLKYAINCATPVTTSSCTPNSRWNSCSMNATQSLSATQLFDRMKAVHTSAMCGI
ncbi:hypothetical protein [Phocaeicola sp.]|uniref:hypothetical protein n=1 Tax=Phocaeicola sp. TaxID=2773926 RepID=UPI0023D0D38F|nr:hypothetical protein [Phocaeicola sp.]MDE5677707.1 hypothetical protein [Phocaeicola sp.]